MWHAHRGVIIGAAGAACVVTAFLLWAILPLFDEPTSLPPTRLFFHDGSLLYTVLPEQGDAVDPVRVAELPTHVAQAILAAEDARFYDHPGIDVRAMIRALWGNIRAQEVVSGASTIEQQLMKNRYFPDQARTVLQKAREAIAALAWAAAHTKDETLEAYLNVIPFGGQARGLEAAAQTYFHVSAQQVNLPQAAMLAGIIAAPSANDPFRNTEAAQERQAFVIHRMRSLGMLTEGEQETVAESRTPIFAPVHPIRAPHAVFRILEGLEHTFPDIRMGGYTIVTTLDPDLQGTIEARIAMRLQELGRKRVGNAAAVAIDPRTGETLAYVGSASFFDDAIAGKVDMAAAKRQPGSALKPFLYLLAFLQGIPASEPLADTPVRFETPSGVAYEPQNYSGRFYGPVSARDALGSSLNVPAVRLLDKIGLDTFVQFLSAFGLSFPEAPDHYGLGLVLGGGEVTLFDATNAYAALARDGAAGPAILVRRVRRGEETVFHAPALRTTPVAPDAERLVLATRLLTNVLTDPTARLLSFGEGNLLNTGWRIAVKTGTTPDFRDNWAFGYTPDIALGVWVGNADNRPMDGVTGVTGAVPIWADVMRNRYQGSDEISWDLEEGLTTQDVCIPSGLRITPDCSRRRAEWFIPGTEPSEVDSWEVRCPDGRVILQPPVEFRGWTGDQTRGCDGENLAFRIVMPQDGDVFHTDARVAEGAQAVAFLAAGSAGSLYVWMLDGQRIETSQNPYFWKPIPGSHELSLEGAAGGIRFSVSE